MKPAYTRDNTRSSLAVVLLIAAAIALVAVLLGLSEKPDIRAIGITTGQQADEVVAVTAAATASDDDVESDLSAASGINPAPSETVEAVETATPEIEAAVEPTPEPAPEETDAADEIDDLPALAPEGITPAVGAVSGAFFTRAEEEAGATVQQNMVNLAFNSDGTGTFASRLEMTRADGGTISVDMAGPITWTTGSPQIEALLDGSYRLVAPNEADNVSSDVADLLITSLRSGSGSLCAPHCFGITFAPPEEQR